MTLLYVVVRRVENGILSQSLQRRSKEGRSSVPCDRPLAGVVRPYPCHRPLHALRTGVEASDRCRRQRARQAWVTPGGVFTRRKAR
jgi:hypothetical protein